MSEVSVTTGEVPAESLATAALTLARRFACGSTMWCVAPEWPAHGRHVAVEFVHPVIVGKRALPAVHVYGARLDDQLRMLARPGDILLAVGSRTGLMEVLMQRADAWGLSTVWLGAGESPDPASASHVIWSSSSDPACAARAGDLVILYHLLWELTHVVFEHPGLLSEPAPCQEDVCVTCSDEGRIAEVVAVGHEGRAEVIVAGRRESVDVTLVDQVVAGDLILVHAGMALTDLERSR